MTSNEFSNLVIVAKTFGILPSVYAQQLFGAELPHYITRLDWYAFDVAAAEVFYQLQRQSGKDAQATPNAPSASPRRGRRAQRDDTLELSHFHGDEIPPWER